MTKTNSTADYFLNYFRYKILSGRLMFFLSVITGVLSFVQSAVMALIISYVASDEEAALEAAKTGISMYDIWTVSNFVAIAAGAAMLGVVVAAAIRSFNFYQQRHEVDMLGSLPLSHSMRFWGDFISGYALSVLPFTLLSVLSIPFVNIAESYMDTTLYTEFFAYVVLTTFFSLTLLYVLTVLAASVSGRVISTIACVIILVMASRFMLPSTVSFIIDNIVGMPKDEIYSQVKGFTPTLDRLYDYIAVLLSEMPGLYSYSNDENLGEYIGILPASELTNILIWTAEIVVITAAAFFLTRFRKAERTGGAFGYKYGFYGFLFVTVIVSFGLSYIYVGNALDGLFIIAAILSAIVFVAFEICMRRGWKNFGIGAAVLAVSLGVSVGAAALVQNTGVFGMVSRIPDADEIEIAWFDDMEFTDREDIEKLRQNHLEFLENYGDGIQTKFAIYSNIAHDIKYKLKNGEVFTRSYEPIRYISHGTVYVYYGEYDECKAALDNLPLGLKAYKEQFLKRFEEYDPEYCDIQLDGVFGGISIKPEKIHEIAEIILSEYTGDTAKDKIIGSAHFYSKQNDYVISNTEIELDIYESYVKTIAFAQNTNNVIRDENEDDSETLCYQISRYGGSNGLNYSLEIRKKDLENEKVKELVSLLTKDRYSDTIDSRIYVYSNDVNDSLYVPSENRDRFNELVIEIIAERVSAG